MIQGGGGGESVYHSNKRQGEKIIELFLIFKYIYIYVKISLCITKGGGQEGVNFVSWDKWTAP